MRDARLRARLSQTDLARRAGVAQSVISAYESDRRDPGLRTLTKLIEAQEDANRFDVSGPGRDQSPSSDLERAELTNLVRTGVAGLAGRQRQALELHQFHERSYAEVAAEMDMTPKAAKSLLYRARHQLRANLLPVVGDVPV